MITIFGRAKSAVDEARRRVGDVLEVSRVPDGSPTDEKVTAAFQSIEEALEEVPEVGLNAAAIEDTGPVVYPVEGRDPRDWPTSAGKTARQIKMWEGNRGATKVANSGARLAAPDRFSKRRVLSSSEYAKALENSNPVPSPITEQEDSDSYGFVLSSGSTTYPASILNILRHR